MSLSMVSNAVDRSSKVMTGKRAVLEVCRNASLTSIPSHHRVEIFIAVPIPSGGRTLFNDDIY